MDLKNLFEKVSDIDITVNASLNDLLEFGQNIATLTAKEVLEKHQEKIYSRGEVIQIFGVCSATLWRWDKLGLIQGRKIGNRRFYPESEIKRLTSRKGGEE